ncbi:lytic transglycosylase domain-containing protein [Serratia proteamaculans]|uniref:lytic transglycosylase domain-containing protein n=1 Tax=Serratia proteamaculans TaxID=28151 RepID=UPI00217C709D|nr:transglycosylase SLT domain-containing protein [Serratia proteamaculans]CAI1171510.1 Membrane-bound lytic murein transglycosylase D precursor [Serratia proteamaculans]
MKVEELVYLVKLNSEAFLKGKARVDLELARMEKSADGAADAVEGVGDAAADAGDKLEGAGKKAGDAGKDFKGAGDDAKKAGDGFEESGEQAEGAGEKVEGAGKKSEKTGKKTDKLGTSFKKTGKDAAKFGKTTAQSFSKVTKYALGFFGVALTLDGARRFFVGTTNDIMALGNAASFMDMPIKQLDGFNKAAEAAGSSASAMGGVLMRVQNAVNWKNMPMGAPDASTMGLMRLDAVTGGKFKIMAAKNAKNMTLAMAQAMRSLPKPQAEQFAGMLGIDAGMFHDIMSGDFEKNQGHYSKKSGQTDEAAKRAREIKKTLTDIQTTAEGVGNAIYVAFGPAIDDGLKEFDKLLQEFGDYIVEHKDDIIGFFKDSATEAGKFADAVGGTSNALKILLGTYIAAKSVGVFGAASRGGIGLLNPTVAGGIAYADWLSDKKNRDDSIDSAKSSWGNTKGTIGDLMRSVGINTDFGRDPNEVRSNAAVTADIPGYSQPVQHAQAARRKRPLGALLSPLLQNHNAMLEKRYQLPPGTLSALAMTESSGNPMAISKAGAMGMYQIMPKTGKAYGMSAADFFDPIAESNVTAKILSENLKHYHGNLQLALAAYNAGVGRLDGALAGHGAPLTDETLNYPGKVLSYMDEYRNYHANTGAAMAPGAIDNSQTAATHINAVHVTSNPATVDELTNSINEQSRRSRLTGSYMSGVS